MKFLICLLISAAIFVLPPVLLHHDPLDPRLVIGLIAAFLILYTQPAPDPKEMVSRGAGDRFSALAIFVGVIGVALVAVLEYLNGAGAGVEWAQPLFLGGLFLVISGLALRIWAIRVLGRFFTATVQTFSGHQLVNTGPYRLMRHPSYTGVLMTVVGLAAMLNSRWGLILSLLVVVPIYLYRIHVEEMALTQKMGTVYTDYTARTKRLVPYVY